MCVGGVLGIGQGFPDNLAIVGDAFLKSCKSQLVLLPRPAQDHD